MEHGFGGFSRILSDVLLNLCDVNRLRLGCGDGYS